jgi:hypothetical protein
MSYDLRAVLGPSALFDPAPAWIRGSRVVLLDQGVSLIPLTTELLNQFGPPDRPWLYDNALPFLWLPEALVPDLRALSMKGPVAYVEAEYDGQSGFQLAAIWKFRKFWRPPKKSTWAINDTLSDLGVKRTGDLDLFDTVGLGRHRDTEEWASG